MKKTRKILLLFIMAVISLSQTACTSNSNQKTSESTKQSQSKVTIQITIDGKTNSYKAEQGSNLLDLVKKQLHADETDGLINSVDGLKSDPANKTYLMFKVNGTDSAVGAADVKLKDGDKIEFYLSKF
ncbi:MAG: DUF4430 domain-containing protein [Streptococcaceae bacterium]|jgi:maltose-binding protein MalE|nr:DUF4430 domain-containing protein [Streptococcaceae bacterium]